VANGALGWILGLVALGGAAVVIYKVFIEKPHTDDTAAPIVTQHPPPVVQQPPAVQPPTSVTISSDRDKFGIAKLNPTVLLGREWFSKWDNGHARSWSSKGISRRNADPDDSESDLHSNVPSKCTVDGKGKMVMEGINPRLYINSMGKKWQNVEMTVYFMALNPYPNGSINVYSRLAARSEHQNEYTCASSGHTMGMFEIKGNGAVQLRKELVHPSYADNIISTVKGPARNVRMGMKYVLRNKGKGILSQAYMDSTGGANGGNWVKVLEKWDTGNWPMTTPSELNVFKSAKSGSGVCKKIATPTSLWMEPCTSCYLRSDGNYVQYDSFSIREIAPLP